MPRCWDPSYGKFQGGRCMLEQHRVEKKEPHHLASLVAQMARIYLQSGYLGSIPGSGRPLGEGHGSPLQYSCLENPMDRGAWRATVHGSQRVRRNGVTNTRAHTHTHTHTRTQHLESSGGFADSGTAAPHPHPASPCTWVLSASAGLLPVHLCPLDLWNFSNAPDFLAGLTALWRG